MCNKNETHDPKMAENFCIVRTRSAGVFAGELSSLDGTFGEVRNAIRLWYWDGAASLSQMAVDGVKYPEKCKFAVPVPKVLLTEVIEI